MTYDLLLIFTNGLKKTVKGVSSYGVDSVINCCWYVKNGYKSFMPVGNITFIGRDHDFNNGYYEELIPSKFKL